MLICDACGVPAKYALEWREPAKEICRGKLCSEHAKAFWQTDIFHRAPYFFQEVIRNDVARLLVGNC